MADKNNTLSTDTKSKHLRMIFSDFVRSQKAFSEWYDEAQEDFEFCLGDQWDSDTVEKLRKKSVRALTFNKIQPTFFLLSGMERQGRSDYKMYPEGIEDAVKGEIATRLSKNLMKRSDGQYKLSEMFEDGIICGRGWIEPIHDYAEDIINGEFKIKKKDVFDVFVDPDSREYDYSDSKFMIALTRDLSEDALLEIFTHKSEVAKIKRVKNTKITMEMMSSMVREGDYNNPNKNLGELELEDENSYDMMRYFYKKYTDRIYVVDKEMKQIKLATSMEEAQAYEEQKRTLLQKEAIAQITKEMPDDADFSQVPMPEVETNVVILKRKVPEIWVTYVVGDTEIATERYWTYPKWKRYPLIPFRARWISTKLKRRVFLEQGIVRSLKDPQREFNKRKTQELRILNSQTSAGWLVEEDTFKDPDSVRRNSSTPGFVTEYKKGAAKPIRLDAPPLPTAYAQLAQSYYQDIKDISGINADALAVQDKTTSGRAIMLRQKQAVTMVQGIFDNYVRTKKLLAEFMLAQMGDLYTVEKAIRVLGEKFILDNFSAPVIDPATGSPAMDPRTGQPQTRVDEKVVFETINSVLNDTELGNYDVSIGEVVSSETIKLVNYMTLQEMRADGVPIPPEVMLEESELPESTKKKVVDAIRQARAMVPPGRQ